jgi:hypothetical protein
VGCVPYLSSCSKTCKPHGEGGVVERGGACGWDVHNTIGYQWKMDSNREGVIHPRSEVLELPSIITLLAETPNDMQYRGFGVVGQDTHME